MIDYLNHVTQVLNQAADIAGRENMQASATLRMIASAKAVAAGRLYKLLVRGKPNDVNKTVFTLKNRPQRPVCIISDDTLAEVIPALESVIAAEIAVAQMVDGKDYQTAWTTEEHEMDAIKDGAATAAILLRHVIDQLQEDEPGPFYCTNCLERHDQKGPCACGVSGAWFKPFK